MTGRSFPSVFHSSSLATLAAVLALTAGCASVPPATTTRSGSEGLRAVGWEGEKIWLAIENGSDCDIRTIEADDQPVTRFRSKCPSRIDPTPDGDLYLRSNERGWVVDRSGRLVADEVLSWRDRETSILMTGGSVSWLAGNERIQIPVTEDILAAELIGDGTEAVVVRRLRTEDALARVRRYPLELTPLSGLEGRFDGWDVADDGEEVVVMIAREGQTEAAIASTSREALNLIPSESLPSTMPRWAPRGYKVSYLVQSYRDAIRSVHVPTAATQNVVPGGKILSYAWNDDGERIAIATRSMLAGDSVDVYSFRGNRIRQAAAPDSGYEGEPVTLDDGTTILIQPRTIRYEERYPVVVVQPSRRFDPRLAALSNDLGVAVALVVDGDDPLDAVTAVPWVDPGSIFVLASEGCNSVSARLMARATVAVNFDGTGCRSGDVEGADGVSVIRAELSRDPRR